MCVDFTNLNKVCKKDDFPLERVDKIVDDAAEGPIRRTREGGANGSR
jgi:hypothetical protein